ncbi:MAG: NAD(P)H-dependent oxidoreductase [Bauldia sp.]
MPSTKVLVFAGSVRAGAFSGKLAALAAKELALADAEVTHLSLADYPLPIYDGDHEEEKGVPDSATRLAKLIAAHHGVFIATPEYNHSLPPLLKNAIDWVSRVRHTGTVPYRYKVYALGGTSDGRIGGARAVIDLRKVLATAVRGIVIPERIEVSMAQNAFDESGVFVDEAQAKLLRAVVKSLVEFAGRLADRG